MFKRLVICFLLLTCLMGCEDDEFGTNPATLPGLFITWQLTSTTTTCNDGVPVVVEPQDKIIMVIRKSNYTVTVNGALAYEGSISFDGKDMFFAPSPFPNNALGVASFAFNGADLVINSIENKAAGEIENCRVRRVYRSADRT